MLDNKHEVNIINPWINHKFNNSIEVISYLDKVFFFYFFYKIVKIQNVIKKVKPSIVFIPPDNDLHTDHSKVHNCALVACRPLANKIKQIYTYEILGYVKDQFQPNVYVDI